METLWVDFNGSTKEGIRLTCNGTIAEIAAKGLVLYEGMELLIWDHDQDDVGNEDNLVVNAIVKYSNEDKCWIAHFDHSNVMNESARRKT